MLHTFLRYVLIESPCKNKLIFSLFLWNTLIFTFIKIRFYKYSLFKSILISNPISQFSIYSLSNLTTSSKSVISLLPLTCHIPVIPGLIASLALCLGSYKFVSEINGGLVPTMDISPPDVKIETTFFQRKFFITTPCNHPQKQHKKRTSDLSEVPILRCFLKILPLSAPLPASYQIPPDCTLNGIYPSNDTSFLYPIRTFSISFAALAHC